MIKNKETKNGKVRYNRITEKCYRVIRARKEKKERKKVSK
jgi:hypothetical protein